MRRAGRALDSSAEPAAGIGVAENSLFGGEVALFQPIRGYRVNVDALLLGHFAAAARPVTRHFLDLGAGVGAVTLAAARFGTVTQATLIERDAALAALARRNLAAARVNGDVVSRDLARGLPADLAGTADVVVANPPFFPEGSAASTDPARRGARAGSLSPFLAAARSALGRRGYAFFVYPADQLAALLEGATGAGLVAKRIQFVHPFPTANARVVLLELRSGKPGGLVVAPPIVEWETQGRRTALLEAIVAGTRPAALRVKPPTGGGPA